MTPVLAHSLQFATEFWVADNPEIVKLSRDRVNTKNGDASGLVVVAVEVGSGGTSTGTTSKESVEQSSDAIEIVLAAAAVAAVPVLLPVLLLFASSMSRHVVLNGLVLVGFVVLRGADTSVGDEDGGRATEDPFFRYKDLIYCRLHGAAPHALLLTEQAGLGTRI